jgi:hypothetical protein
MSDLNPTNTIIKLNGKEYGMRFTINSIDAIQDHFDIEIINLPEVLKNNKTVFRNIRYVLTVLINEGIDCHNDETGENNPHVDEAFVGRNLDLSNIAGLRKDVYKSLSDGIPKTDSTEGDENPNA